MNIQGEYLRLFLGYFSDAFDLNIFISSLRIGLPSILLYDKIRTQYSMPTNKKYILTGLFSSTTKNINHCAFSQTVSIKWSGHLYVTLISVFMQYIDYILFRY